MVERQRQTHIASALMDAPLMRHDGLQRIPEGTHAPPGARWMVLMAVSMMRFPIIRDPERLRGHLEHGTRAILSNEGVQDGPGGPIVAGIIVVGHLNRRDRARLIAVAAPGTLFFEHRTLGSV
jgi:hypothetical protein